MLSVLCLYSKATKAFTFFPMNSSAKQEMLYEMLERLQLMAREIPPQYQQRLPYDLLSTTAHLLMDSTVFEIVKELLDLQYMSEKHLYQQRADIVLRHKSEKENIIKSQKEEVLNATCQGRAHVLTRLPTLHKEQLSQMETRHSDEITKIDRRILQVIDEKVEEQQSTLEQVGLPAFKITKNPVEIRVQMYILGFILKLGNISTGPS